jgi:two-component system copper resistance phosphate regulon response regulator CusR
MRLLVVEDEEGIAVPLRASLEAESFVVDVAADGERGSFLARTNEYDLIVLDNMLPKKNGHTVCQEIRKDGKTMPILMLSVLTETETKVDLLNNGADDYLGKPFSFTELLARIRALLRRQSHITEEVLRVGDIVLEVQAHRVKRGGREIRLTRKEFILLEYFMRNPGIVLSRGKIMEHVWDINADPFSNTIEAHIRSLRQKMSLSNDKKFIHTFPGRGYKIECLPAQTRVKK